MAKFNANSAGFSFGNARPVDQNGDYKIDANDRVIIGSTEPKFVTGLTNTFNYKNFELSFFIYGRMNYLSSAGAENLSGKTSQRVLDYYTENNINAAYQKPIYSAATGDQYHPTLGYLDGSFLKIRNISLGYNFTDELAEKIGVSKLRMYLQASNPGMLFSKAKWMDFDTQTTMKTDGGTIRPDMVINLPGGKTIVIDAKVPFNSYLEASQIPITATGEEAARRKTLMDAHVKAVRSHVDALSSKSYWSGFDFSPELDRKSVV